MNDFASSANSVVPTSVQVPTAIANKINTRLWLAIQEELSGAPNGSPKFNFSPLQNGTARRSPSGDIEIVVEVATWSAAVLDDMAELGIEITLSNQSLKMVQGWASPAEIDASLYAANVEHVSLPVYGVTNVGAVETEGDAILQADEVRSIFASLGIDGSGIRVGVISDGVQNRTTVDDTGDLPSTITVNPALPGLGDEGTAMLEIIHDLAPGAELYFSSGLGGTLAMIDSVNWLVSQGVDIIVDDLSFFDQPYFQDGAIANTISNAVAAGVSYFSAAGNQAQDHYQADFLNAGTVNFGGNIQQVHDFGGGDIALGVNIIGDGVPGPSGGAELDVFLQWSDPFGGSTNDYNLFLVDQNGIVLASSTSIAGVQDPVQRLAVDFDGPGTFTGFLVVGRDVGAADRELELFVLNDVAQEFAVPNDGIFGHQAITEVVTVGAINQADVGNDTIQAFSNRGPSTIYTNFNTQTSLARNTLDGAGIDGVQTRTGDLGFTNAFGANLDPFFGTSAAAPHVAAIAALILDINPALTPAQVSNILTSTAVDIDAPGYDINSGFGRFNAYAAAVSILPPKVINVTVSGSGSTHTPFSFNDPNDDANDFDGSGIQLRTVPVGGADTVSIELSEHVLGIGGSSLTLTGLTTGTVPQLAVGGFSYDVGTHIAQWTFDAPFDADQYLLSLADSVTDVASNALDGEWTNPFSVTTGGSAGVSVFPSGNGTAGHDFNFVFTILPGDGNLDNNVGGSDFLLWQRNIGVSGHTFFQADYDGNGNTDSADNAFWQTNYGTNLRDLVFADFNGDGVVNGLDEGIANTNQGIGTTHAQGDADNDGDVDSTDLAIAQMQFGLELDWVA